MGSLQPGGGADRGPRTRGMVKEEKGAVGQEEELWSDSEHNFLDENIAAWPWPRPRLPSSSSVPGGSRHHAPQSPTSCHPPHLAGLLPAQEPQPAQPRAGALGGQMKQLAESAGHDRRRPPGWAGPSGGQALGKRRKWGAWSLSPQHKEKRMVPTRLSAGVPTDSSSHRVLLRLPKVTAPTAAGSRCPGCPGASVPQRRAGPSCLCECFRPHAWGGLGCRSLFIYIYIYRYAYICIYGPNLRTDPPTLTHPNFPSTLKKKLRLLG